MTAKTDALSDRELLELAAKAAGLGEVWYLDGHDTPYVGDKYELGGPVNYATFSPLTDDGDALRLAVKLGIDLTLHGAKFTLPYAIAEIDPSYGINGDCYFTDDAPDGDPCAATRRAIVRAAAAIAQNGTES